MIISLAIAQESQIQPKEKWKFLQKYWHKGAFFQETSDNPYSKDQVDDVYTRDYSAPTGEDKLDKSVLPKVMQVRLLGCVLSAGLVYCVGPSCLQVFESDFASLQIAVHLNTSESCWHLDPFVGQEFWQAWPHQTHTPGWSGHNCLWWCPGSRKGSAGCLLPAQSWCVTNILQAKDIAHQWEEAHKCKGQEQQSCIPVCKLLRQQITYKVTRVPAHGLCIFSKPGSPYQNVSQHWMCIHASTINTAKTFCSAEAT